MDSRGRDPGQAPQEPVNIAIVTVPDTGTLTVRFLGPVDGIWTHWRGKASAACLGEKLCKAEWHRERTIWKGYCAVEWLRLGTPSVLVPAVLEVTEGLAEYLGGENLRGQTWRLTRAAVGKHRTECRGTCLHRDDPRKFRTDIDVQLAVKRLYRTLWVEFGKEPPFGARQRLSPIAAGDGASERTAPRVAIASEEETQRKRRIIADALKPHSNGNGHKQAKPNA